MSEHKTTEETFYLSYTYSLYQSLLHGSDRDNILYSASCHAGARLSRSPGVSLAPHLICRVWAMAGWPALRMRSSRLGAPHPACCFSPAVSGHPRDHHVWYRGGAPRLQHTHRHISISFSSPLHPVSALSSGPCHCAAISHHFQTFQTGSMMNVFNNLFSISGGGEGWEPI